MTGFTHGSRSAQDTLTTTSFGVQVAGVADPLRRLMAAVLQTALDDCRGSAYGRRLLGLRSNLPARLDAADYVASTDRSWPFSFENLCEALGLDAGHVRHVLRQEPGAA
jgi:hypothetical protein